MRWACISQRLGRTSAE